MLDNKELATAQVCRTCNAPLDISYLEKLSESAGRWLPCPGDFCPEYCRKVDGELEQQRAVVLRRQLLI